MANQSVLEPNLGESASCGKMSQAYPWPLVNNGSGPFHCLERGPSILLVVLHSVAPGTNGEALQFSDESAFKLFITKKACCKI